MSKQMVPNINKVNIYPMETKPNQTSLLSPGIDDNYVLSSTTEIVTPYKKTPKEKEKAEIRKQSNIDLGKPYSYHNESG